MRPARDAERVRVLVVDDENGPRQALRMLLKRDHEVDLANDVRGAIDHLRSHPMDVVITDLRMPDESGIELLRWVKESQPETQVIILTGYAELETAMKAVEYGAFAYIEKPFDNETILKQVQAGVARYRQEQQRRHLEQAALEGNRFEALGRLMAGMIHDLAAPLTVIESQLEITLEKSKRPDINDRLKTVQTQARHCRDVVGTAMNFIRHQRFEAAPFHLNDAVVACLEVAQPILRQRNVAVTCDFMSTLDPCFGDVVLVRQAILNLIMNACHAMEESDKPPQLFMRTWTEEVFTCVSVEDTGPGVPPAHWKKVFEPFFTSRTNEGTGLGLLVVRNVMERHGGSVVLRDNPAGGAAFVLKFPQRH